MLFNNADYFSSWDSAWKITRSSGDAYNNWMFPVLYWTKDNLSYIKSNIPKSPQKSP